MKLELKNVIPTVGVLIFRNNNKEVLLVRHKKEAEHLENSYGIPAGRIDQDDYLTAAIRELYEETGLIVKKEDLVPLNKDFPVANIPRSDGTVKQFLIKVFICRKYSGSLKSQYETIPEWAEVDSLDKYDLIANTKDLVVEGLKYLNNT